MNLKTHANPTGPSPVAAILGLIIGFALTLAIGFAMGMSYGWWD